MFNTPSNEILRSSWALDGVRIFLEFNTAQQKYVVATRWVILASFSKIHDAIVLFEAVEMGEETTKVFAKAIMREMVRTPSYRLVGSAHARIISILDGAEKRMLGLRPVSCGSKGGVIKWIGGD